MSDIHIDVSTYNNETNKISLETNTVLSIMKWFGFIIGISGLLIIIIALIRALYVRKKRKKLLVEGEISNYLKFDAISEGERASELATNTVQL